MRRRDISVRVAKRLVDIGEKALAAARAELGTRTLKDTVNEALRRAEPARGEGFGHAGEGAVP